MTATAQQTENYHCAVWIDRDVYFSDQFAIPRFSQQSALTTLKSDFVEFVKTKYSLHNITAGCTSEDKSVEEANAKEQKRKIIETGWKYTKPIPVRTGP